MLFTSCTDLCCFALEEIIHFRSLRPSLIKVISSADFFFKKDFVYLFDRQRSQVGREAGREREGEAGSLLSREPHAGLDHRTLGSWPELKAEALTH